MLISSFSLRASILSLSRISLHHSPRSLRFESLLEQADHGLHENVSATLRGTGSANLRLDLGPGCDGCGTVTFAGQQAIGDACVDLRALGFDLGQRLAP